MDFDEARDSVPLRLVTGVIGWPFGEDYRGIRSWVQVDVACWVGSSEHIQPRRPRPAASVPEPGVARKRQREGRGQSQPSGTGTD
jgi:hypothetical protein